MHFLFVDVLQSYWLVLADPGCVVEHASLVARNACLRDAM